MTVPINPAPIFPASVPPIGRWLARVADLKSRMNMLMTEQRYRRNLALQWLMLLLGALCIAPLPAFAQPSQSPASSAGAAAPTTQDVTINLIHLLVQQNIITAAQADALFTQAKKEAAESTPPATGAPPTKSIRVTYVPEVIRDQITEQTKKEVLEESKSAPSAPSILPEWMRRVTITGDFRMRYERQFNTGQNYPYFGDYNTVNQGSPVDISPYTSPGVPVLNTTQNRQRYRLRARLEIDDRVNNATVIGMRLTTGSNTGPVSPNQTQGSDFSQYPINLDRAFLRYTPTPDAKILVGRFASPWLATDLVWYNDLNFDGVAAQYNHEIGENFRPFVTAGVFPIENTALGFPTLSSTKVPSRDKWLYAGQIGLSWLPSPDYLLKIGAAYYDFAKIQGNLSAPCSDTSSSSPCNTDNTRAGFLQRGNTVFAIRNPTNIPTSTNQVAEYQYYGLASRFRVADLTARFDVATFAPVHVTFNGEFAYNTAFDRSRIIALNPDNNLGPAGTAQSFASGPMAFQTGITVGMPEMREFGDWSASVAYKYLEADSVVDAFNDADFHGGGTNAKGYVLRGNMGLGHNVWVSGNFFSATEVSGPPLAEDTLQMDLNARF